MQNAHTLEVTISPSFRARMTQDIIGALAHVRNINAKNCSYHRKKLENLASRLPRIKGVQSEPVLIEGIESEWMNPATVKSDQVLYYLHGGGYAICSVNTHRRLIAKLSKTAGVRTLAINYRLAPEHPFPAAIEDAVTGYEHLLQQGIAPGKIVIAGDSAGGGLAIATLLSLKQRGIPLPSAAVCIAPWTDLEGIGSSHIANSKTEKLLDLDSIRMWGKIYAGNENLRHPLISPIYADLSGLPPLYIQVSSSEILLDDSIRLHERALAHGVKSTLEKWRGLIHVWHVHTFLPDSRMALANIANFIHANSV